MGIKRARKAFGRDRNGRPVELPGSLTRRSHGEGLAGRDKGHVRGPEQLQADDINGLEMAEHRRQAEANPDGNGGILGHPLVVGWRAADHRAVWGEQDVVAVEGEGDQGCRCGGAVEFCTSWRAGGAGTGCRRRRGTPAAASGRRRRPRGRAGSRLRLRSPSSQAAKALATAGPPLDEKAVSAGPVTDGRAATAVVTAARTGLGASAGPGRSGRPGATSGRRRPGPAPGSARIRRRC